MTKLLCRSCPSGKIKGLSLESSKKLKTCKNCSGRIFMEVSDE